MNDVKRNDGYALITSLIVTAVITGLVVGFISNVNTEQKIARNDTDYSSAFYAAEAGLEKLNSDLSKLFQQSVFPTQDSITGIQDSDARPNINGVSFATYQVSGGQATRLTANLTAAATTATVTSTAGWPGSGYFMIDAEEITYTGITSTTFTGLTRAASNSTAAAHASNARVSRAKVISISEGPSAGLNAQVIPFSLEVVAQAGAGSEARLRREVQVALIPVFQFGVFSDSDLSFFAGPVFNFGGRVHTNGNLFLAAGGGGTTLSQKVTSANHIIRTELANTVPASVSHTGNVFVVQTPGTTRALATTEASLEGGPGSMPNSSWHTISLSTYNGNMLNIDTGAKPLVLPFAGGSASPIEIIKRALDTDEELLGESRLYNQASIRILLSDAVANLPGSTGVLLTNAGITGMPNNYAVSDIGIFRPPLAQAEAADPDYVTAANADETAASELIDGYIKIEYLNTAGAWTDVTMEILNLGLSTNQANAIIRLQKPRWDARDTTTSITATDYVPLAMYDARETHFRIDGSPTDLRKIGIMNLIELDVNNMARWFAGTIGASGTQAVSNNGYIVYFSDRRGNRNTGGNETGEFGFEDIANGPVAGGAPNGLLDAGEDLNGNGTLDVYGANLPYNPWTNSSDIYTTSIPVQPAPNALPVVEPINDTETGFDVVSAAGVTTGHYRIGAEVVNCTSVDTANNRLTCARGTSFGTAAAAHDMLGTGLTVSVTTTTATAFTVASTVGLPTNAFYRIDNEFVYCTAMAGFTMTCSRGMLGSTAATHTAHVTWSMEDITDIETTIDVNNAAGFTTPGYYKINDNEIVRCTIVAGNTITCTRGVAGTVGTAVTQVSNTMNGAITNAVTSIPLDGVITAAGWVVPGYYRLENEVVYCLTKNTGTKTLTDCTRGALGTTAAAHADNAALRTNISFEAVDFWQTNMLPVMQASKNRQHYFRRALRLVNGGNTAMSNVLPTPGFTVTSENPLYILGNYNAYTGATGFGGPHSFSAVIADAVTLLSNAWNDNNSFTFPASTAGRGRSETNYRVAIAAGKGRNFTKPDDVDQNTYADFGTDGGTHNFLRYLEQGGSNIYYRGSIVSLYFYRQATGTYKCCSAVYSPPARQYAFDTDFLVPSQLPPGTPRFRDINNLAFRQTIRADTD